MNITQRQEKLILKISLITITVCVLLMTVSILYVFFKCNSLIQTQTEEIATYTEEIATYKEQINALKKQVNDLTKAKVPEYISSTKEYAAWVEAQSSVEPYDLYEDLQYAYEQYTKFDKGTNKYKTALNLLVPKSEQDNLKEYNKKLKRYFGTSDRDTAANRFIDDLVSAGLLKRERDNYFSWNNNTLTPYNVKSKLNLTTDVANAMLGTLRTWGWDVRVS